MPKNRLSVADTRSEWSVARKEVYPGGSGIDSFRQILLDNRFATSE
jgi:hypothetical protein